MKKNTKAKRDNDGITRKAFLALIFISFFALAYINFTSTENLRLSAEQFPEINISLRKAFVEGYKMFMSLALFFIDIILVGPFAWLSYFSDHISPKRVGPMDYVSFFDLGLLLAIDFTMAVISFHFTIINVVDKSPITIIEPSLLWIVTGLGFILWLFCAIMKMYTYSADQRKDLKKYIMKF